jgi:hypothetical protein
MQIDTAQERSPITDTNAVAKDWACACLDGEVVKGTLLLCG